MVKKIICLSLMVIGISLGGVAQKDYEAGIEITGARGSNLGGIFGGVLKFSKVEHTENENQIAFGPSVRYQYYWSNNSYTGIQANGSMFGFGAYVQYRFLEWFYVGAATEIIQNPFIQNYSSQSSKWTPVGFLGGGIHKEFDFVALNVGFMYDTFDALRGPNSVVSSPLSNNYFLQKKSATNSQQAGGYIPLIARVTFYFPLDI